MIKHFDITIKGKVQGVYFRHHTKEIADKLGIRGIVQNQDDGTVRIEAEGNAEQVKKFLEWCKEGPDTAAVDSLEFHIGEIRHYQSFEIT